MAFATTAEFANRLGVTFTAAETTDASSLLDLATEIIKSEAGQTIEAVANDALTRPGTWNDRLRLPERPVTNIDSITLDGDAVDADSYYLDGDEIVRAGSLDGFPLISGGWGGPDSELVITYDHGYDIIPGIVKAICLEMVRRVWVNPGSVQQEGYGSEQVSYGQDAISGLMLTDSERKALERCVRNGAGSIQLR